MGEQPKSYEISYRQIPNLAEIPDKSNQSENVPHSPQKTPLPSKPTSKPPSRNETPAEAVWRMRERENVPHAL